ncbi:bifunctional protein-serine/threonine kinase/phosphatase [Agitococcus lubricus]|uniref:Serine/threonine protein kinase n=1 Tax=Agitococcus lubricus TaxID=1077255 RepID=A0A2T5IVQ6_9GAMM|nr:bifunctional protein-serine/threonine kinase/phosphatase [Agitococcus lubricus]PTQ87929.1 serine/threonine protein kinase [Agitococcus lubricus]
MSHKLTVRAAQRTETGPKATNDDALGLHLPQGHGLSAHTAAAAIADGVSSADGGRIAAETSVTNFLSDFFATPSSWSIKTAGSKVLAALNRWLHGQGQHYQHHHQGYLTTFTALIMRGQRGYIFHIGDTRLWRLRGEEWECLTTDHALNSRHGNQLTRALGMDWRIDIDYLETDLQQGDIFVLTTDGIHSFVPEKELKAIIATHSESLETRCEEVLACAASHHSDDNRSCQLLEIIDLPHAQDSQQLEYLAPLTPELRIGDTIDGYQVEQEIQINARSHIYLVKDCAQGHQFVLKTPSPNLIDDIDALKAFVREDWIGQRFHHPHIVNTYPASRARHYLYLIQEYLEGQTLRQWRMTHPEAAVETILAFAKPVVHALRALHRRETLHQDIKPDNIFLCTNGVVKLIDLGSASIGSLSDNLKLRAGAAEYAAPEYALGIARDQRADQFSLAMTLYELLTAHYAYGEYYKDCQSLSQFRKLRYTSACQYNPHVPLWIDAALARALSLNPEHRYAELSEFLNDLEHPNPQLTLHNKPWLEQNPLLFWQVTSILLLITNGILLALWLKQ